MPVLFIINGDNEFLKERKAREVSESFLPFETFEFRMPDDEMKYNFFSQSPAFSSRRRSFIIWDAVSVPRISDYDDALIVVSDTDHKLSDEKAQTTVSIPNFRKDSDFIDWILEEGERRKIDLNRVAGALFVNNGICLRKIASEIEKLSVIVDSNSTVSPEEAKSVMCMTSSPSPSLIVDLVLNGKMNSIPSVLDVMDENNAYVISVLIHDLQRLLSKDLLKTHTETVKKSIRTFCELDKRHRTGDSFVRIALEIELLKLAEEFSNGRTRISN